MIWHEFLDLIFQHLCLDLAEAIKVTAAFAQ